MIIFITLCPLAKTHDFAKKAFQLQYFRSQLSVWKIKQILHFSKKDEKLSCSLRFPL